MPNEARDNGRSQVEQNVTVDSDLPSRSHIREGVDPSD
jgi:hypothetical protein